MAASNYNAYSYPYQQSSAQQHPAYPAPTSSNSISSSSHHPQRPTTSRANDYASYQAQPHGNQRSAYGPRQDNSWSGHVYGAAPETTNQAAEVLRNMSNTPIVPSSSSVQPVYAAKQPETRPSARYNSNSPHMRVQQIHGSHGAYPQAQPRSRSVNANQTQTNPNRGLPPPATAAGYSAQQTQTTYQQHQPDAPAQHYSDYGNATDPVRSHQHTPLSNSYDHTGSQIVRPPGPTVPPATSAPGHYLDQGSTTVDPTVVYDPWPEYQRKAEAMQAQKATEDAARAEEQRIAKEAKEEEERKRKDKEEAERAKAKKPQKQANAEVVADPSSAASPEGLEMEIRAMMAKMRELNSKDPALLARIWEEERRAKPKTASEQPSASTAPGTAQPPTEPLPIASSAPPNGPKVANQRKKAAPKEKVDPSAINAPKPGFRHAPVPAPTVEAASRSNTTIWPAEKKATLASAAAGYINTNNPNRVVDAGFILGMLDKNPSYIELCELLEREKFKLDRAAFARNLLSAVPDVNSSNRKAAPQATPAPVPKPMVPPAIIKKQVAISSAIGLVASPIAATPYSRPPKSPASIAGSTATPVPVAEMVPIKPELKQPANKEEAARKRNMADLVDLTQLSDNEDLGTPAKRVKLDAMRSYGSLQPHTDDPMAVDSEPIRNNFPIANGPSRSAYEPGPPMAPVPVQLPSGVFVKPLDKKKALRRNTYNPATIARDVLLACGRHPSERQLNEHLNALRVNVPIIGTDSDLSTINWGIVDPGNPPPGYFKDSVHALTKDAADEDDSDSEKARLQALSHVIGDSGTQARVQALPEASNPFKQHKRRGRPPRHSYPNGIGPSTPKRSPSLATIKNMNSSVPHSTSSSVGYSAFRTNLGADGQPLPKKRGRPVGWRKAIHGSPAAQARVTLKSAGSTQPPLPSSLHNVQTNESTPIRIDSRSPSVPNRLPEYLSYKCKWRDCPADLHNMETLRKHVSKVHGKEMQGYALPCFWDRCNAATTSYGSGSELQSHLQEAHLGPLAWKLGDGPAGGLSDAPGSEAYLSDAQGRQVTPRIRVSRDSSVETQSPAPASMAIPRGRGRPPKKDPTAEAREIHDRLVAQKERLGGPGMDRGGAILVNDKRRRGFIDNDMEEELVDAEEEFHAT